MLTPEEIQSRGFLVSLRGYDRDEVHAFLDEVAEAFSQLKVNSDGGGETAAVAPAPVVEEEDTVDVTPDPVVERTESPFAAIGAETQRILDAAQKAGKEIRRRAQTEADTARTEVLAQAEKEVEFLREQAAATQEQIDILQSRRNDLTDRAVQARETVDVALLELKDED